jgi:hypothetical protein
MAKEKKKVRLTEFDKLAADLTGKHSKRMNAIILTQSEEMGSEDEFCVNYFKLLEYVHPKLQRTEIQEEEKEIVVTIEHVTVVKDDYDDES